MCDSLSHLTRKTLKKRATFQESVPVVAPVVSFVDLEHLYKYICISAYHYTCMSVFMCRAFQLLRPSFRSWISSTYIYVYLSLHMHKNVYVYVYIWICVRAEHSNCRFVCESRALVRTHIYQDISINLCIYVYKFVYLHRNLVIAPVIFCVECCSVLQCVAMVFEHLRQTHDKHWCRRA